MELFVLDTDHVSILRRGGFAADRVMSRASIWPEEQIVTCVVVFEEQMRGWMAEVARQVSGSQLQTPYSSLATTLSIDCAMTVLTFDERAADYFDRLKAQRIRIGTQDLKIAAITLARDATLITRIARDFGKVPGLRFEDWSA